MNNLLADRIEALIPEHPEILTLKNSWDLFKIPGFQCDDLGPSMAQADAALAVARGRYLAARQPQQDTP